MRGTPLVARFSWVYIKGSHLFCTGTFLSCGFHADSTEPSRPARSTWKPLPTKTPYSLRTSADWQFRMWHEVMCILFLLTFSGMFGYSPLQHSPHLHFIFICLHFAPRQSRRATRELVSLPSLNAIKLALRDSGKPAGKWLHVTEA